MKISPINYSYKGRLQTALNNARSPYIDPNENAKKIKRECALIKPYVDKAVEKRIPVDYNYIAKKTGLTPQTVMLRIAFNPDMKSALERSRCQREGFYTQDEIVGQWNDIENYLQNRKTKNQKTSYSDIAQELNIPMLTAYLRVHSDKDNLDLLYEINNPKTHFLRRYI